MSRERKLSKWSLTNALSRSRTVVETARYLGVHRDTVYENAKRFEVDIPAVLGGKPTHSDTPSQSASEPRPTHLEQVAGGPFTEDELRELESHGWTRHDCPGEACVICHKVLAEFDKAQRSQCECGRVGCLGNHKVNPASYRIAARPRSPVWCSYAYKGRRYDR